MVLFSSIGIDIISSGFLHLIQKTVISHAKVNERDKYVLVTLLMDTNFQGFKNMKTFLRINSSTEIIHYLCIN